MILLLLTLSLYTQTIANIWEKNPPKIAVLEYPLALENPLERGAYYLNQERFIQTLAALNESGPFDLILFPETPLLDSKRDAAEMEMGVLWHYPMRREISISLLAAQLNSYVIATQLERVACSNFTEKRTYNDAENVYCDYYITTEIHDRNGQLIQKYRKKYLFGREDLKKPQTQEAIVVDFDFGARMGLFGSYDILFKSPALDLAKMKDLDGVLFPNQWFSELPFRTSLQVQQMWAQEHKLMMFSSGLSEPKKGSGGTGVFNGVHGTVASEILPEAGIKAVIFPPVSNEPEDFKLLAKSMDKFHIGSNPTLRDFTTVVLKPEKRTEKTVRFLNRLSCNFQIELSMEEVEKNRDKYIYQMVAYSGLHSYDGVYTGWVEICGLVACLNTSVASCGQRFPNYDQIQWPFIFENVTITAKFQKSGNRVQYPNSVLSTIRPIDALKTTWVSEEHGDGIERTFSLREKQTEILTFAIYGRDFDHDLPFEPSD